MRKSNVSKTDHEPAGGADGRLRLRAVGDEDLRVISACLQDAVVAVVDIAYLADENRFLLVANRLRREGRTPDKGGERILCGICFESVTRVQRKGLAAGAVDGFLSLLSLQAYEGDTGSVIVELTFSGGAAVRVTADRLRVRLDDMGEAWPTQWAPDHEL